MRWQGCRGLHQWLCGALSALSEFRAPTASPMYARDEALGLQALEISGTYIQARLRGPGRLVRAPCHDAQPHAASRPPLQSRLVRRRLAK